MMDQVQIDDRLLNCSKPLGLTPESRRAFAKRQRKMIGGPLWPTNFWCDDQDFCRAYNTACQQADEVVHLAAERDGLKAENKRLRGIVKVLRELIEQLVTNDETCRAGLAEKQLAEAKRELESTEREWQAVVYLLVDAIGGKRGKSIPEDVEWAKAEVLRLRIAESVLDQWKAVCARPAAGMRETLADIGRWSSGETNFDQPLDAGDVLSDEEREFVEHVRRQPVLSALPSTSIRLLAILSRLAPKPQAKE